MSTASARGAASLERVVVTTADGRVFDLGSPTSPLFRVRVLMYRSKRKRKVT